MSAPAPPSALASVTTDPVDLVDSVDPVIPIRARVAAAVRAAFGDAGLEVDLAIHRSAHADYQADVALALARRLKANPRETAATIAAAVAVDDVVASASVSGPGFINLTLRPQFLAGALARMAGDGRLGVARVAVPETVVIDYSSPNLAKEMHVGNLRSTIIGDALARLLAFQGHRVIRQNHLGDWGTPFGMLLEHLVDESTSGGGANAHANVRELVAFYRAARVKFDTDPAFAERARTRVVLLQGGDAATLALWQRLIDISVEHLAVLYQRLGVTLSPSDVAGESRYNAELPQLVADLESAGIARPSDGAICVFPPGFTGRDGEPTPLIVRKQDGGYGYATTDLAALRYRVSTLGARRLIYVVGTPQSQHLAMVFAAARLAGWADQSIRLEHVAFGSVLGPDKKMFKTRSGESISLASLIDEAIERAAKVVKDKTVDLDPEEQARIAESVGVGAIKYADLSNDRIKDYVFDWNRMLAFDGNTAPYLMYAHARIRSILRKAEAAGQGGQASATGAIVIEAPEERALALELLQLGSTVEKAGESLQPHRVCQHLHEVATAFTGFYEKCPVLKADEAARASRLALCELTARVLAQGLDLLGIGAPRQM